MLYRLNILEEKSCMITIYRIKVVLLKDCHSSISAFDLIRINNISSPKINKKLKLGHLEELLFQVMNITSIREKNYYKTFLSTSIKELQFYLEYQYF